MEQLSDKAHNKKWLNFAIKELRGHRNAGSARHKEAEDYVEDVKLKILSGEIVLVEGNGNIDNFICGIIRNDIKVELRKEPVMVALSYLEDHDDEGEEEEQGIVEENLIINFEDPFADNENAIDPKNLMKVCYELLEKEDEKMLIVFDERTKGHQNRDIAKYLCLDVREVENMWKRVVRLLKKKVNEQIS
jgi:DNA-directed RNA polymerase specialized sigma24 family protein